MIVTHLNLSNFRNYATADVALVPGPNLFVGRNGQGKTNLVEAIGYLSSLGSHRVSNDQALIRAGEDAAIIRIKLHHDGRDLLVEVQLNRSSPNRAQVNRGQIKPRELPRYVSSVLFAPEDLGIVRGDPGARRRFIDQLLVLRTPRLASVISDYERTLKQRNSLLKSARGSGLKENQLTTLEIWDDKLIALGSEIIDERVSLAAMLTEPITRAYADIVGDDHGPNLTPILSIDGVDAEDAFESGEALTGAADATSGPAVKNAASAQRFRAALQAKRRNELERGLTLVGPHRDDILFELNGLPVKGYASHGESWSFALSLKLAAAELLRRDSLLGDPVLILDDVFAELDQQRRARLARAVSRFQQVLITAAVLEDVPAELTAHTVHISGGTIIDPSPEHDADADPRQMAADAALVPPVRDGSDD